jgi:hypothetical protein
MAAGPRPQPRLGPGGAVFDDRPRWVWITIADLTAAFPVELLRLVGGSSPSARVGDNGAGKSTLIKAISGIQPADARVISIDGKRVKLRNAKDAYQLGIATVYQDLALCDNLDVVANLFLGGEKLTGMTRSLDEYAMEHKTLELASTAARPLGKTSSPRSRAPRHRPDRGVRDPGDPLPAVPNGRKAVDAGAMRAHTIGQRLVA